MRNFPKALVVYVGCAFNYPPPHETLVQWSVWSFDKRVGCGETDDRYAFGKCLDWR